MRYLSDDGKYLIQIAPVMSMSNGSKKKKRMKKNWRRNVRVD